MPKDWDRRQSCKPREENLSEQLPSFSDNPVEILRHLARQTGYEVDEKSFDAAAKEFDEEVCEE